MRTCISFLLLLLLSFNADAAARGTCKSIAGIEQTCRSIADSGSIDYEFCVSALQSHPSSRSTDLHGLAVAATRLAIDSASGTESKIEELMELEEEGHIKNGFEECLDVFSTTADRLKDALDNMNAEMYQEAMGLLGVAVDAHDYCERVFMGVKGGAGSPLAKVDRDYWRLADIAMAIAAYIE